MSDSEFMRSEFYNEAIRPMGTFHGLAVKPLRTPLRRVFITPGRRLGTEDYGDSDVAAMQLLVPHIVTALQLGRRIASADMRGSGACAALEHLDTAILLVGEAGKIIYSNRIADALLARSHIIGMEKGCISLRDNGLNRIMLRMIDECADVVQCARRPRHMIGIPREDGRPNLRMIVAPFAPDDIELGVPALGLRPAAIVMISDPEQEVGSRKEWLGRGGGRGGGDRQGGRTGRRRREARDHDGYRQDAPVAHLREDGRQASGRIRSTAPWRVIEKDPARERALSIGQGVHQPCAIFRNDKRANRESLDWVEAV
jgi:hypothetical protein